MSNRDELLAQVEADFESGKRVVEELEVILKNQDAKYDPHIARLNNLRFVFTQLVKLRDMQLAGLAETEAEVQEPAE